MTAKTDRELLELAARAVGGALSEGRGKRRTGGTWDEWEWYGPLGIHMPEGPTTYPLIDDGDALRLTVALGISIDLEDCSVWKRLPNHKLIQEYWGGDYPDSYKHAIVRAAAAIGETL